MFFLILILIIICIIISFCFSRLELFIENLNIKIYNFRKIEIIPNYNVIFKMYIFKKVRVLDFNTKKLRIMNKKVDFNNIQKKMIENKHKIKINQIGIFIKLLKKIKVEIKNKYFEIELGTEDAALTAILVGILYIFFSKSKITPVYNDTNKISLNYEGVISVKMIHIISTYILYKKISKKT